MVESTGERRIVSVLMADIAGSTAIGERIGPERSKFLFDEVVRLMSDAVGRYEGTVAQLAGDGLLALFGAPVAHEDDAERAVRAALDMQCELGRYAADVESAYGVALQARIGVNTGPVVIAGEEDAGTVRYNALGDTVNVAARLQTAAPVGEVALGPTTRRQVEGCFDLQPLGALDLKGKSEPVEAWSVAGEREAVRWRTDRPMFGREFELTVLERAIEGLVEGRGVVVSIMGEAGIGKTRLVAEASRTFGDRVSFVEGRGVSYAQAFPYWPVRELLREWLGVSVSTPEARLRLELKAALARHMGAGAEEAYPFVAHLLGVTLEPAAAERLRELSRESVQRETFRSVYALVCRIAEDRPLCLVLEDLHWADESSLELLEELLAITEEAAVGLVLLHRTEREHASWRLGERARQRYPHRFREIELRPLPDDKAREVAAHVAGAALPADVAGVLVERAGGNPFFLEEALRDLLERGALRRVDGAVELAVELDELAVPALVQGALQARLDRLEPDAQEVLSLAAVIGRTFGMQLMDRLMEHGRLMRGLSELQRLDLVVEHRRRPTPEYRFRHGLVQEVAYARLLESTRRALHRRVGEAMEDLMAGSLDEVYPLLARHFAEADDAGRAVDYLLKAGDAARALYADREAVDHYRRARTFLARLGDDERSRETLFKIALAHHLAFDYASAELAYDEAFCCRAPSPPADVAPPSERIEVAMSYPGPVVPGDVYTTEGASIAEHLFEGLLMVDADLNVLPAAADNFRVSADGLEYLFQLREGLRWSDGHPLTAADFVYAWQRARDRGSITAFLIEDVESAEALDDRTLQVRVREPRSYFPYILALPFSFPLPRHRPVEDTSELVGNGPFRLVESDREHVRVVANPHWTGVRGNIREVEFRFPPDSATLVDDWRAGRYDVAMSTPPGDLEDEETIADTLPGLTTHYLGFRADTAPLDHVAVRRALAHAIDTEALAAWVGMAKAAAGGALPPAIPGHAHGGKLPYDPDRARALLGEAGFPQGRGLRPLRLIVPDWMPAADVLVEQLGAIGVRVSVEARSKAGGSVTRAMEIDEGGAPAVARWAEEVCGHPQTAGDGERADIWVAGWTADFPDPDGFFRGLIESGHLPLHRDEDILDLLRRARTARDKGERLRLYNTLDRLWVGDRAALVPIAYSRKTVLRRPWIEGVWGNPLSHARFDRAVRRPVPARPEPQPV